MSDTRSKTNWLARGPNQLPTREEQGARNLLELCAGCLTRRALPCGLCARCTCDALYDATYATRGN